MGDVGVILEVQFSNFMNVILEQFDTKKITLGRMPHNSTD